jgi:hypothetical protein
MTVKPPDAFSPGGTPTFEESAKTSLADSQLRRNLGKATQTIRAKRGGREGATGLGGAQGGGAR